MNKKEFKQMEKEIDCWNKFKQDIKEKINIISVDNYDEDSIIFRILKITKKKDKDSVIKFISAQQENTFIETFNAMQEYENKDYIEITKIPSLENVFGMIQDRIKSNKEMIEFNKKEFVEHTKKLQKEKDYKKIEDLQSKIFWDKHSIERYEGEIRKYEDILRQLKHDIKNTKRGGKR